MIDAKDLAHALDNSTPYPVELPSGVLAFMAARLNEMLIIEKNETHHVWDPEPIEEPCASPNPSPTPG